MLRVAAGVAMLCLSAALLVPIAGAAAGAAGLLALTSDLPDVAALRQLPNEYGPSAAITRLYARQEPDGALILIDEIVDPRHDTGWAQATGLPPQVSAAYLAAIEQPVRELAIHPSVVAMALDWWRTGNAGNAPLPLAARLIRTHLRDGEPPNDDPRRAFQDRLLANRIDSRFTTEQQVEWALNTEYYGHLAYGIEAAAKVYFGKRAADLTAGEAAALAVAARDPAANPFDNPATAEAARADLLATMAARGDLTATAAAEAAATALTLAAPPGNTSPVPSFARLARRELEQLLGPERLLAEDLDVETTLDPALQAQVECVAAIWSATLPSGGGPSCPAAAYLPSETGDAGDAPQAAIVALNPATGEIEALLGDGETPRATGTLVRPFIFLTALSQGYTAATLLMDVETSYPQGGQPYAPRDPDSRFLGPLRLREAAAAGRAAPAAQALSRVGAGRVAATARALGLRPATGATDLSLVDVGFPATLLELAGAFATVGNGGLSSGASHNDDLPRPTTLRRVTDLAGETVHAHEATVRETLAPELAYLMTDILADEPARCRTTDCPDGTKLPNGRTVALATGRAPGNNWAIGYTPERLVGVRTENGEAAPLWRAVMAWAEAGAPETEWPRPPELQQVEICAASGLLPSAATDCLTVREWFIPGTEPSAVDTMTREVAINRQTGRLATIFTPPQLIERRAFIDYPPEAAEWAKEAGIELAPTEYDTIRRVPTRSGGAALDVEPWSIVSGLLSITGSAGGDGFSYYRLAYFPGLLPEAMQTLVARGETPVESAELGAWDTTLVEDGLYTLLLTVVREDGTFDEVAVPVTVENARP